VKAIQKWLGQHRKATTAAVGQALILIVTVYGAHTRWVELVVAGAAVLGVSYVPNDPLG
jgi:hypothetical protein